MSLILKKYARYREIGKNLNKKILNACLESKKDVIFQSAKLLGMVGEDDVLCFGHEGETNVLMDFIINDYKVGNENLVKIYQNKMGGADKEEKEILNALARAYTSLFKIIYITQGNCSLYLYDMLNKKSDLVITDVNLSKTTVPNMLLFFRYVSLQSFNATAGTAFVFPVNSDQIVLKDYWQIRKDKVGDDAIERFIAFSQLSKVHGQEARHIDIFESS